MAPDARRSRAFLLVGVAIPLLALASCAFAPLLPRSGDLEAYLHEIPIPGRGSYAFVPPTEAELAVWRQAVAALVQGRPARAAALASRVDYDLVRFRYAGTARTYFVLVERRDAGGRPLKGRGTYVYTPRGLRALHLQVPHPLYDRETRGEGIFLFLRLRAAALSLAGTHRNANETEYSPCDGTFLDGNPYRISDVAHFDKTFFEVFHEELLRADPQLVALSLHGFSSAFPYTAIVSNGTPQDRGPGSLANRLADALDARLSPHGLQAGSCNAAGFPDTLCGTTNVQGRFANGSPDLCRRDAPRAATPERFLQLEQQPPLRRPSGSVSWETVLEALAEVFPPRPYPSDREEARAPGTPGAPGRSQRAW